MRKYIFSVFIALLSLPVIAQQQSQAKAVLDKTAEAFRKAGSVKVDFTVKSSVNGRSTGESSGMIQLKGNKFFLEADGSKTWFDGRTQWSLMEGSDEVNVSNPTEEELQTINPYAFLNLYQKGFKSKLGSINSFRGKSVEQVILTASDKKQQLACIILYVAKDTYQPLYILLQQRGNKNMSEITISGYQVGQNYTDAIFTFDKKQYPNVEVIDLR